MKLIFIFVKKISIGKLLWMYCNFSSMFYVRFPCGKRISGSLQWFVSRRKGHFHCKLFYTDNVDFIWVILSIVIQMVEPQHFCLQCLKTGGLTVVLSTYIPVVDSFWYLAKLIWFVKFKNKIQLKKKNCWGISS